MSTAKIKEPKALSIKQLMKKLDKENEDFKYFREQDRRREKAQIEQIVKQSGIALETSY